ncbi:unnamed protein product [Adineta steineri]|uniref:Uncharacterized protein n=1 Tax=Adineta steineri TaxID=433720 RepID=A0A813Z1U5_9BILA|nr:unnamed protein product [Adineta steineri]CAF4220940.1 unnamed protein product [Adineta steineri]
MSLLGTNLHLQTLQGFNKINEEQIDSSDDSEVEVTSEIDEHENHIINFNTYLNIHSDDEEKDDKLNNDSNSVSPDSITTVNDKQLTPAISNDEIEIKTNSGGIKRKRRQWSIIEKLKILNQLEKNGNNKNLTAQQHDCTRFMLSQWQKQKEELLLLTKQNYGKKRKRERRGIIQQPDGTTIIRKEKVSFKQLQRQGKQISVELHHESPSPKWYGRFLRRHGLSLQKLKRHQKIPLNEVHKLVNEFYVYLRRSSRWGPKRSPMGAFTPSDVCNMDERPLSLFGDQSKLSVNEINTCNEIEGHISNKRFCTLILTVFADDNSGVGSVLLFRGIGKISENEKKQYASDIKVFFTPKAVNNRETMDKYLHYWKSKVKDNKPKLFITDSSSTHLNDETLRLLPSQSRILCTRLTSSAWKRTLTSIDMKRAFINLGYTWSDNSPVQPRNLPGYSFDPDTIDYPSTNAQIDEDTIIEAEANKAHQQHLEKLNKQINKQLKISEMWKK